MSESEFDTPDLRAFEQALQGLAPAPSQIDRDALMFRLGQQSVSAPTSRRAWLWPLSTAAAALLAFALGMFIAPDRPTAPRHEPLANEEPAGQEPTSTNLVEQAPPMNAERPQREPVPAERIAFDSWLAGAHPFTADALYPGRAPRNAAIEPPSADTPTPDQPERERPLRAGDRALWRDIPDPRTLDDLLSTPEGSA